MLDPNPSTRISIDKIMSSSWFKKPTPRSLMPPKDEDQAEDMGKWKETETLNAFHIISLSEGFNLSPLFTEKKDETLRFATAMCASNVISRIEEVGKTNNFSVNKSEWRVCLKGQQSGRKGKLRIAADVLSVAPSFVVVEVTKSSGDTLEYNQFCNTELRPALKDIEWTSATPS